MSVCKKLLAARGACQSAARAGGAHRSSCLACMLNALSTGELLLGHAYRHTVSKCRQQCRLPTFKDCCKHALQEPVMGVGQVFESQRYANALLTVVVGCPQALGTKDLLLLTRHQCHTALLERPQGRVSWLRRTVSERSGEGHAAVLLRGCARAAQAVWCASRCTTSWTRTCTRSSAPRSR